MIYYAINVSSTVLVSVLVLTRIASLFITIHETLYVRVLLNEGVCFYIVKYNPTSIYDLFIA